MTQEDPLAMVAYGIGFLPFIKRLKAAYPDVTHPWYADNTGELVTYDNLELYFNLLKQPIPGCGYYTKTSKIILIVAPV